METTQDVGTTGQAEPSLETAWRRFNDAFNRFDVKQVAECWTEDGTLLSPTGELGRGRAGVEAVYRHDTETILAGTSSTFTIRSVRRLGDDLAFIDLDHEIRNCRIPDGSIGTMMLHTAVLARKSGGAWRWLDARPYAFLPPLSAIH